MINNEGEKGFTKQGIKNYILLYSAFLIYSGTTVCAKFAAMQGMFSIKFFAFFTMEIFFLGVYAIIWQQVLKQFDLVVAMATKGVVVILGLLWSVILFQETVTLYNVIGALLITSGIWVVSNDD